MQRTIRPGWPLFLLSLTTGFTNPWIGWIAAAPEPEPVAVIASVAQNQGAQIPESEPALSIDETASLALVLPLFASYEEITDPSVSIPGPILINTWGTFQQSLPEVGPFTQPYIPPSATWEEPPPRHLAPEPTALTLGLIGSSGVVSFLVRRKRRLKATKSPAA